MLYIDWVCVCFFGLFFMRFRQRYEIVEDIRVHTFVCTKHIQTLKWMSCNVKACAVDMFPSLIQWRRLFGRAKASNVYRESSFQLVMVFRLLEKALTQFNNGWMNRCTFVCLHFIPFRQKWSFNQPRESTPKSILA